MKDNIKNLIDRLASEHRLEREGYLTLICEAGAEEREYLATLARAEREKHYGRDVYIRGLIEISNICKND